MTIAALSACGLAVSSGALPETGTVRALSAIFSVLLGVFSGLACGLCLYPAERS